MLTANELIKKLRSWRHSSSKIKSRRRRRDWRSRRV